MHYHLNLFQQNLFIQQVNINIYVNPTIQNKLQDLDVTFSEFKTACELLDELEIIRDKALRVLSRYRDILDNKMDFYSALPLNDSYTNHSLTKRQVLNLSLLETGLVLLSSFLDNTNKFDNNKKIAKALYKNIQELYLCLFPNKINEQFFNDLKFYEFLIKEDILKEEKSIFAFDIFDESYNSSRKNNLEFSDSELEDFFKENRKNILKILKNGNIFPDPLKNEEIKSTYEMYKKIKSFSVELEDPKLITVKE